MAATQELSAATGGGGGGMVMAEDGSSVPSSFYSGGSGGGSGIPFGSMDMGDEVDAGTVSDQMWSDLQESGYRGNPNDGRETIYAPNSPNNPVFGP